MKDYFIRRLLLLVPTLLGITVIAFVLTRFVPGGPLDKAKAEAQQAALESGNKTEGSQGALSRDQMKQLERYYGFDKPALVAYAMWLGLIRREADVQTIAMNDDVDQTLVRLELEKDSGEETPIDIVRKGPKKLALELEGKPVKGWFVRLEPSEDLPGKAEAVVCKRFEGILQWDFGKSYLHNEPVWDVIKKRFPISIYFGLITIFITYCTCIPLGIIKAMRHREFTDTATSVLIFIGYAIPGYVLGTILIYYFAFEWKVLPDSGFGVETFGEMLNPANWGTLLRHTILPLCCYLIGSFAIMTMLMKNQLMDNLAADYVRTAIAKGVSFKRAVLHHAFRNSLVPIATGFGQIVSLVLLGSFLIETIFDINGFGLLGFTSIVGRDYPVVMGILIIGAFLMLLGNIISDICVAFVDPRIRFGK